MLFISGYYCYRCGHSSVLTSHSGSLQEKLAAAEDQTQAAATEKDELQQQIETLSQNKEQLTTLIRELQGKIDEVSKLKGNV